MIPGPLLSPRSPHGSRSGGRAGEEDRGGSRLGMVIQRDKMVIQRDNSRVGRELTEISDSGKDPEAETKLGI